MKHWSVSPTFLLLKWCGEPVKWSIYMYYKVDTANVHTSLSLYLRIIEFNILTPRWWNCRWVSSVGTRRRGGRARGGRGGGGRSRWGERTRCWTSRWRRRTKASPTSPGNDRTPKDKASDFRHCSNLKSWPQENIANISEMKFSVLDIGFTSKRALSRHLTFPRIQNTLMSMSFGRMLKTNVLAALREFPCFSPPWTGVAKARDLRQSDI